MREILFRGFCENFKLNETVVVNGKTVHGKWVCGYFLVGDGVSYDWIQPFVVDDYGMRLLLPECEVIPETIGQFTGLLDKNGKKIFEGDRIIAHEEDGDCQYSIRYKADQNYPAFDCDPYIDCDSNGLSYLFGAGIDIEVIGTIFDVKGEEK
jgi:hypothetical protein